MQRQFHNIHSVTLSVVAPCYNEESGLDEFHRRVSSICQSTVGNDYEIVLVNDGSKDATLETLYRLAATDDHLVVVDLARNYGQQIALSAGLEATRGARVLILDADLQDPPELLPQLMERLDQGADVAYGQRRRRDGEGRMKLATAHVFYRFWRRLVDIDMPLDAGEFRLISRRALDHVLSMPERYRFVRGMISWVGLRQDAVIYDRDKRFIGETKYNFPKMIALAMDGITSFSIVPLRLASHLGFFMGIAGLLMLLYTSWSFVTGRAVEGWTSLASIMLVIGSGQFLVLGIFGEYLGRMYMEAKRRPLYIVNEIRRGAENAQPQDARDLQEKLTHAIAAQR
ncbi:glycosyltransferase family 2 protein [Devosia sp. WQ 349]|uniref:glycosyltransferase family 2 protein n=1 Tax=Devosia sp. WQ 349K1 TaxID=2800329 RepID=UPI00190494CA|nr:glycosyltransferase family 2 protein [Devosia sp. WQ 349K1]